MSRGIRRVAQTCDTGGRVANAALKVRRYSASGTTHNSGTAATSVEMCVVTPIRRLEGTKASASHDQGVPAASRVSAAADGAGLLSGETGRAAAARTASAPVPAIMTINSPKPANHRMLC